METLRYEQALEQQLASWNRTELRGRWLLFTPPPVITLGRRAQESDVLLPEATLERLGIQKLAVDRGGLVTYHGPGQIVGFPLGPLAGHSGDMRGVRRLFQDLQAKLRDFIMAERGPVELECNAESGTGAGIWEAGSRRRKIVAFGMRVTRHGIAHGFALNVHPVELAPGTQGFDSIVACGNTGSQPGFIFEKSVSHQHFEELAQRLQRRLET